MTAREAYALVVAKRQEHQLAAGLKATAGATQDDHFRAGQEWVDALCAEYRLERDDLLGALLTAEAETSPNVNALAAIGAIGVGDIATAAFGGGFFAGLATGLELAKERQHG